ncbi:MAG: Na/Pi symporter [Desulfotignum sp.]
MLDLLDGWKFLAGLGIFLFGMFMMEESIKLLSGRSFKILIRRYTGTRIKGLITGIVSTAILQSSSAVSLMVLAFVGAGLVTLVNAIAVIMGAKVGTTITAWIVAVFGFKFKIETFALPLIGLGGVGLIFLSKSPRYINISKLLIAFGFLFHGLDFMKTSVEHLAGTIDLASLPTFGPFVYILAGILLTAIMQSSSATIAVVLTTLFSGIIDFQAGAAMVIGANVGTTVTILLGAIGGAPAKKQAAVSSLLFSTGTATIMVILLPLIFWLILDVFAFTDNPVLGVALFHTLFNVMGVIIFFPAIPLMAGRLDRLFIEKQPVLTRYIINTPPEVPDAAIAALRKEISNQLYLSILHIAGQYNIYRQVHNRTGRRKPAAALPIMETVIHYEDLERLHADIFAFYARIQAQPLDESEAMRMEPLMRASRSIMNATRNFKDILGEINEFGNDESSFMRSMYQDFLNRLSDLKTQVEAVTAAPASGPEAADMTSDIEGRLNSYFFNVEEQDKQFIQACAGAVDKKMVKETDISRLLMANRLFTQSCRMIILSLQGLTRGPDPVKITETAPL